MSDETSLTLHPDPAGARVAAEQLFAQMAAMLRALLPPTADIRHIGATAIPGCLTKGDLDIAVRVEGKDFEDADRVLAHRLARNAGSVRTDTFSAFEDAAASPHLGIQLTAVGGPCDDFHLFVDALNRNPHLIERYNALKQRFNGCAMEDYRAAKAAFVATVLASCTH